MTPKRKTRMYEPWGYQDQNDYQGAEIIHENDLDSFFAGVEYKRDDNKIHFTNKDGDEVGSLNVNDFVKSDSIIEKTEYKDGILKIYFTNGDIVTIDLTELLDENEFKDGLIVDNHTVKVLVDGESERWLTVSTDGVKVSGIQAEIDRLDGRIDDEIARATSEEQRIEGKLDQEIQDRIDDVDEEEARAIAEEARIEGRLNSEITRAIQTEQALDSKINTLNAEIDSEERRAEAAEQEIRTLLTREINDRIADVNEEEARAKAAEQALDGKIYTEESRALSAETDLQAAIEEEGRRAQDAEAALQTAIETEADRAASAETNLGHLIDNVNVRVIEETADRKANAVASAEYNESGKTIDFYNANNEIIDSIDVTDFIKDGMIDDVKIENGNLVIVFNTDSGKETIEIPLTDIFNPANYYTKGEIDGKETALQAGIDANAEAIAAEESRAISAETDLEMAISGKADADAVYTQEEVDALLLAKENEIYNLTKIVGDMGGAVTYEYPNETGKSLTTLLGNNGTVKLTDDATITRFGPGVSAKNNVKLNLNNHNITSTSAGSYGAIMSRGTQEITIYGKGTIDSVDGICIEANGENSVINLTGSTTVYQNDRSGGELIYCYAGTINITNGTFKNLGENKGYMLNCYDTNYTSGKAKIIVTGGKFYDFNPADNNAEGEHTSFVPEGYHIETSIDGDSTVYTVKKD